VNDILKQRLVGALILVALGVVFWPIIFVEPGERSTVGQGRIPPAPVIDTTPIGSPDQEGLRASPEPEPESDAEAAESPVMEEVAVAAVSAVAKGESTPPPQEPRTRTVAPEKPVLDSKGVPVAWVLQVASVSSAAKADELRDRLLTTQEKAYVKKLAQGEKVLYRVYVGPNFERAQLEKIQAGIDSGFGVRSIIVRYTP
jgi:DedD protein